MKHKSKILIIILFLNIKLFCQTDSIVYYFKYTTEDNGAVIERIHLIKTNDTVTCILFKKKRIIAKDYGCSSVSKINPRKVNLPFNKKYVMKISDYNMIKDFLSNKAPDNSCVKKYDKYYELWYYRKKNLIKYSRCFLLQFSTVLLD